jgi:hypothetical protein
MGCCGGEKPEKQVIALSARLQHHLQNAFTQRYINRAMPRHV